MKRRIQILTGALALVLLATGLAPSISRAQSASISSLCTPKTSCFVFTPAFAAGPAAIDLYLDSKLVAANIAIANSSALISIAPGTHWLQLPAANRAPSTATITASLTFDGGGVYDLVLRNADNAPHVSLYKIDPTLPASGLNRSRIVNLWAGAGTIDVDLGDPGDKTGGGSDASFVNIRENGVSSYVESGLFSNQASVSVFATGTADLKAAPALRPCPPNSICSYVLVGPAGKQKNALYSVAIFPI